MTDPNYDTDNIFAKILRGEIPCDKVYEDEHVLAFRDIAPQAPVHLLVIPKGKYISLTDFTQAGKSDEIEAFFRAVGQIVDDFDLVSSGYRTICNTGHNGGQEVPHFHLHILGGEKLGAIRAA